MKLYALIETFVIFIVLVLFNYFFSPKEMFYSEYLINIYLYALIIISLFYGFIYSLVFYILYFAAQYFFLGSVDIFMLSHYFIFLLIFSEFKYFWNRKLEKLNEENSFLKRRVEDLGNAYYLLKISHDELEKNYILKPFSIREILKEIKESIKKDKNKSIDIFLNLLKKLFKLEQASLFFKKEDGDYELKGNIGEKINLDMDDELVKQVLENKHLSYSINTDNSSKYIAVIPVVSLSDELKGLFVIKSMPFFSLSKDNLITISLFLTYFVNLLNIPEKYHKYVIDPLVAKEIESLRYLSKKYGIKNHIVIFNIKNPLQSVQISKMIRGVDIFFEYKDKLVVILPFTNEIGVNQFLNKVLRKIDVEYKVYDLMQMDLDNLNKALNEDS
ncbi:hypothetical protein NAMH_1432 [Nautilia profundicola AmH]|uniref:PelD GGDEF domain-containing protein n=1 Tax=Nautilia profundicola (strain ATCC BAA-1463 / DSM 18972 / AmH) TaxID=598659 RepID=B9L636_NAUPA|nr:YrzE family protein [Nautilia profundicola]ACM92522.1 hypothetical protein NAMH_1432 [Nautilia profundicola AmH]